MTSAANEALLMEAATALGPLLDEVVFIGGATVALFITDTAAPEIRGTKDVDVIVEVSNYIQYQEVSARLRDLGFREDTSEDALICRWIHGPLILDVIPTDRTVLGWGSPWLRSAVRSSRLHTLKDRHSIRLIDPAHFVITKIDAYRGRGTKDPITSEDLEDLIAVIDGRPELSGEVTNASPALREAIAVGIEKLITEDKLLELLPGFLPGDPASQARITTVRRRLEELGAG